MIGKKMAAGFRISMGVVLLILTEGFANIVVEKEIIWLERAIGENGDQLKIGEADQGECFPSNSQSLICNPYSNWEDKQEFLTRVYKLPDNPNGASMKMQAKDYFFAVKRDLWRCRAQGDPNNEIWRMEVELMGIKEIASIQYHKDYDVSTKYYLSDAKHKRRTAWVEGATYYKKIQHANGDLKTIRCKYEGGWTIGDSKPDLGYWFLDTTVRTDTVRNELKSSDQAMIDLSTDTNLPTIWIGKQIKKYGKWERKLGKEETKARCRRVQGVKPAPTRFYTKVKVKTGTSTGGEPVWKSLTGEEQLQYIIPLKQQVWKCREYSIERSSEKETYSFYRIVNEMVSRVPLHKVQFGFTVVEALKTILPMDTTDGLTNSGFKITEIVYRFPLTRHSMNYLGSLELLEDDVSAKDDLQREVSYYLQPKVVYETFIGKRGFDLRVGSRLVAFGQDGRGRIGSRDTVAKCEKEESAEYNKAFDTQIKLVTSIENEAFGTSRIQKYMEPEYYTYITRTVAKCSFTVQEKEEKIKYFLRIMNVIEIRVAVRTIQTYDTVSVAFTSRPNNEKAVRIVEIKYLDPGYNYSVGRYDGKVDFSSEDLKVPKVRFSVYEVKRTNDDITRIVGPYQWGDLDLRYFDYSDQEQQRTVGEGEYDLTIGSKGSVIKTMEGLTETSVARCSNIEGRKGIHEYLQFTLTSTERSRSGRNAADDVKVQDDIIIGFEREWLWKCTVHETTPDNKPITFYFVENEVNITNSRSMSKLRYVKYYNGDRLSLIESEDGQKGYRIRRFYFLDKIDEDPTALPKVFKYSGYIVRTERRKDTSLFKSGSEQIMGKSKYIKRVYEEKRGFHLKSGGFIYKTFINDSGSITLKLGGTRWEGIISSSHITGMQCVEKQKRELQGREFSIHAFEHFNTFFRTEVSELGGRENVFDNYFESLKQEYWECTPKNVSKSASAEERVMKMIRIVNQFSVKPHHCNTINEMHHYDGFTFMVGESDVGKPGCMEINEIKYLRQLREGECEGERVGELIVTKYEGKITLIDGRGREVLPTVAAVRLKNVARKDTMYLLPEDRGKTVFRKVLAPLGIVVAIGTPHNRFADTEILARTTTEMRKSIFKCGEMSITEKERLKVPWASRLIIRAYLYDDAINLFKSPTENNIDDFVLNEISQKCLAKNEKLSFTEKEFYRIRYVYTLKDNMVVSRVFHTDGVKVHTSNAHQKLQIEHIIYYNTYYQRIRFDGFIADEGLSTSNIQHSKDLEFASDFIHYHDFSSIMEQCEAKIKGVYLEVGSPYAYDITSGEDDVAYCYKSHESYVSKPDEAISTRIFSRRNILEDKQDNHYRKINGFVIIKQELYWCSTVKHKEFYRVVNEIIDASQSHNIHGIYHHDGITILQQTYPTAHDQLDVTSSIRIMEVKYLQRDDNNVYKVVRYDGEIRVVSEIDKNIITWFQMPSVLKEYPIEAGHDPSEEKILRDHNYWPVEVLKALALKQKPESFNQQLPYPKFPQTEKDNQRVLAKVIPGKNRWRFMIGTPWEIYRNEPDKALRCILDEWNPKDYFQFSTDVVLYVMDETDEKIHNYLDEETILDYFKLNKTEVWVCVNIDQEPFLRVVTELVGIVPIQLIEHYDSVQVETVKITGEYGEKSNTAKITETKIVDANTLQTVRYDGLVKLLQKIPPQPQPSFKGWAKRQFRKIVPGKAGG